MIFCLFADCVSLREISNGLHSTNGNLNHSGILRAPSKSKKAGDNTAARHVQVKPGSIVVSDRGYFDTRLLNFWDSTKGVLCSQSQGQPDL